MDGFYENVYEYNATDAAHHVHRLLGADAGGKPVVDYGVISIVIATLALVLAIEVGRHHLDVLASGNPFFQTVLEMMYRELTTLGLVEFFIHNLHVYWKDFNYKFEAMFVDVHFMLFYTALFNAIQSCFVRLLSSRSTDKNWVQTEDMDIDHYIHIRREFDRLEDKAKSTAARGWGGTVPPSPAHGDHGDAPESSCWNSFQEALHDLSFKIRHPRLHRRKKQLLLPIRFHELRAHFIESNDLPSKFKVSHYLKRSLTSVLLDFVHIHSAAWILLMATANMIHFLAGMLLHATGQSLAVEKFLTTLFFTLMVLFVAVALVLYFKMKSIFSNVLRMRLTTGRKTFRTTARLAAKSVDQVTLFWWNSPHLIIVATQYMQFGYALGLAMIATYHKDFDANHRLVPPGYLLLVLLTSYLIFLFLVSAILPWYTCATSLGQLVNNDMLHETLAKLKLSDEICRKEVFEDEKKEKERKQKIEAKKAAAQASEVLYSRQGTGDGLDSDLPSQHSLPMNCEERNESTGVHSLPTSFKEMNASPGLFSIIEGSRDALDESFGVSSARSGRKKTLSDGVKEMLTSIVEGSAPAGSARLSAAASQHLHAADGDVPQNRKKSLSDGVKEMLANIVEESAPADSTQPSAAASQHLPIVGDEKSQKSVKFMKNLVDGPGCSSPTGSARLLAAASQRNRKESLSDGVTCTKNVVDGFGCTSPTGSARLSAAASQRMLIADDEKSQPGKSVPKREVKCCTRDSFNQPVYPRQEKHTAIKSELNTVPSMRAVDLTAVTGPKKGVEGNTSAAALAPNLLITVPSPPITPTAKEQQPAEGSFSPDALTQSFREFVSFLKEPTRAGADSSNASRSNSGLEKDVGIDAPNAIDQSVNVMGAERVSETRQRSHSTDGAAMMRSAEEADVIHFTHPLACSALKESGTETPTKVDQSWNIEGTEKGPETGFYARKWSSSTDLAMMRSVADTDTLYRGQTVQSIEITTGTNSSSEFSLQSERLASLSEFTAHTNSSSERHERKQRRRLQKTQSEGVVSMMRSSLPIETVRFSLESEKEKPGRLATLSELSQMSTKNLPDSVPGFSPKVRPRRRLKSSSAGVAFMRAVGTSNMSSGDSGTGLKDAAVVNTEKDLITPKSAIKKVTKDMVEIPDLTQKVKLRRRLKSSSAGVGSMRALLTANSVTPSEGVSLKSERSLAKNAVVENAAKCSEDIDKTDSVNIELAKPLKDLERQQGRGPRRGRRATGNRKNSQSEGVGSMRFSLPMDPVENTAKCLEDIDRTDNVNIELAKPSRDLERQQGRGPRRGRRDRGNRKNSQSEGVDSMRFSLSKDPIKEREPEQKYATLAELSQMSTRALPHSQLFKTLRKVDIPGPSPGAKPRPRRPKSSSAGVGSMRGLQQRPKSSSAGVGFMRGFQTAGGMTSGAAGTGSIDAAEQEIKVPKSPKNNVTFLRGKSGNASAVERNLGIQKNMDSFSFDSDDGESDFGDVPEALLSSDETPAHQSWLEAIAPKIDLAVFFQGAQYRTMSLIFGPMACFFLIAMRVQIFNIYAGDFIDQTAFEEYSLTGLFTPAFWLQVSLYCLMIVEMLSVLVVFLPKRGVRGASFSCSAAVFGLLISVMCLLFLLIAEIKRTCPDSDNAITRLLAPSKDYDEPVAKDVECNPKFGQRNEALGTIEPFTCLIAFFPLRFFAAWYVRLFGSETIQDEEKDSNKGEHDQHSHHGPDSTSKVRDLWMTSIGTHSGIARSFGLFSAELLQCMLGIYVEQPETSDAHDESTVIISCKPHEREESMDVTADDSSRGKMSPNPPAVKQPEAHVDCLDAPIRDTNDRCDDRFAYPNARLIRKMRRCEMRLLPLVNEWEIVDVVITKHELILFDVQSMLDTIGTCTKYGGKRSRLCSVAKGRKVMDKFNLDDVNFVDIEHRAPILGGTDFGDVEMNHNNLLEHWEGGNCSDGNYVAAEDTMDKRWGKVNEDRLKIRFKCTQMTLFMRFMADLKDMEDKSKVSLVVEDDSDLVNHVGTEIKLWCRTIARLRGATNLKQSLPHFGNDSNNEMEDFIETCERDGEGGNNSTDTMRKRVHRRFSSLDQSVLTPIRWQTEPTQSEPVADAVSRRREERKRRRSRNVIFE